ncbi:MAG: peptidoglycan-binding protein LysM [Aequorivita sp.]|mgnify:CR=1 FL=1|nr:peptidoglycan-binding protein LysM [Aequorivita sp.]
MNFSISHITFKKQQLVLLIIGVFGLFFGNSNLQAQQATTTINLVLNDVIAIDPESAANGGNVNFNYEDIHDYNSEKTNNVPNSLIITFSKPFDLKVRANGTHFENGSNSIPVDVLTVKLNESSSIEGNSAPVVLSTSDQVLISGVGSGSKLNLDLDYIIPQERSSSSDILGKPSGSYTQQVTYTATAL